MDGTRVYYSERGEEKSGGETRGGKRREEVSKVAACKYFQGGFQQCTITSIFPSSAVLCGHGQRLCTVDITVIVQSGKR